MTSWYFSYFPPSNRLWRSIHIFSLEDDLHEMSKSRNNWTKYCKISSADFFFTRLFVLRRQFAWNVKICFLGKARKIFQNVVCWFYFCCSFSSFVWSVCVCYFFHNVQFCMVIYHVINSFGANFQTSFVVCFGFAKKLPTGKKFICKGERLNVKHCRSW